MPTYKLEQYELHAMCYRVEAGSETEAVIKLLDGDADPVEQSQDFIEVAEDYGMPADDFPELVEALRRRGMHVNENFIPSIRSIDVVWPQQPRKAGETCACILSTAS